jgi:hypothetical protein
MVMGTAALVADRTLVVWIPGVSFVVQAVRLLLTIMFALAVLAVAAHILKIREFREGLALMVKASGRGAGQDDGLPRLR